MTVTLRENQYQIGDMLFGDGTPVRVTAFEPQGYDVNVRDRNLDLSDEVSFGFDSMTPKPIAFEMAVLDNYVMALGPGNIPAGWQSGMDILEQLKFEWRSDRERKVWNSLKPLRYKRNGPARIIYGRPRKFTENKTRLGGEFIPVVAEFMPADTISYSDELFSSVAGANESGTISRTGGGGPTWVQILIAGPVENPKVVFDGLWEVEVLHSIGPGQVLEINSNPWQRRVVDSESNYLSARLIGESAYLSDMVLPPESATAFEFTGSGTTSETACVVAWREAYLAY